MTWKEFVDWAEARGIKPDDDIFYIDFHLAEPDELSAGKDETCGWSIS